MAGRKLVFRRVRRSVDSSSEGSGGRNEKYNPLLGALKGLMQIAPGTDLTKPADPDWGKD